MASKLGKALPDKASWKVRGDLDVSPILAAMRDGADLELDVLPAVRATAERAFAAKTTIGKWSYFVSAIRDHHAARTAGEGPPKKAEPVLDDDFWRRQVASWKRTGTWLWHRYSDEPNDPATKVPGHILAELGVEVRKHH